MNGLGAEVVDFGGGRMYDGSAVAAGAKLGL